MPFLFPTGSATEAVVRGAVAGLDAEVVVTGEIASFLTPRQLLDLVRAGRYDYVVVSGMCTASFAAVEAETGVPVLRGPRHAADLPLMVGLLGKVEFSRDVPADDLLRDLRRDDACRKVSSIERNADWDLLLRGVKVGGTARCKVLAELMDAHRRPDLRGDVERAFLRRGRHRRPRVRVRRDRGRRRALLRRARRDRRSARGGHAGPGPDRGRPLPRGPGPLAPGGEHPPDRPGRGRVGGRGRGRAAVRVPRGEPRGRAGGGLPGPDRRPAPPAGRLGARPVALRVPRLRGAALLRRGQRGRAPRRGLDRSAGPARGHGPGGRGRDRLHGRALGQDPGRDRGDAPRDRDDGPDPVPAVPEGPRDRPARPEGEAAAARAPARLRYRRRGRTRRRTRSSTTRAATSGSGSRATGSSRSTTGSRSGDAGGRTSSRRCSSRAGSRGSTTRRTSGPSSRRPNSPSGSAGRSSRTARSRSRRARGRRRPRPRGRSPSGRPLLSPPMQLEDRVGVPALAGELPDDRVALRSRGWR